MGQECDELAGLAFAVCCFFCFARNRRRIFRCVKKGKSEQERAHIRDYGAPSILKISHTSSIAASLSLDTLRYSSEFCLITSPHFLDHERRRKKEYATHPHNPPTVHYSIQPCRLAVDAITCLSFLPSSPLAITFSSIYLQVPRPGKIRRGDFPPPIPGPAAGQYLAVLWHGGNIGHFPGIG